MKSAFVAILAVAAAFGVLHAIRRAGPKMCEHCEGMSCRGADAH